MIKLKTIIVDDEYLARLLLKSCLSDVAEVELVAECENGRQVLEVVSVHNPDLIFMDIQMSGMNGIEIVKALPVDTRPMIIFTTAYDRYAVSAFETNAVDYLLKPLDEKQVERGVQRAVLEYSSKNALRDVQQHKVNTVEKTGHSPSVASEIGEPNKPAMDENKYYPDKLFITDGDTINFVSMKDIDWVDAAGDYMCVHSDGVTHIMRSTMKDLLEQLDPHIFKRIHRSTILNMSKIERAKKLLKGEFFVYLSCGEQLKVSRSYSGAIKQHLAN
jgi:two-component system LytT family response regulator